MVRHPVSDAIRRRRGSGQPLAAKRRCRLHPLAIRRGLQSGVPETAGGTRQRWRAKRATFKKLRAPSKASNPNPNRPPRERAGVASGKGTQPESSGISRGDEMMQHPEVPPISLPRETMAKREMGLMKGARAAGAGTLRSVAGFIVLPVIPKLSDSTDVSS